MFEGTPSITSFWTGKVEDKQAKRRITEAADFWVAGFLSARPELTEGKGTKILAKALRETIKQTPSPQEKEAIVAVADVIKSQPERDFSLNEIAETYLSQEARQTFTKVIANSAVADIPFRVDAGVLEKEFKFQLSLSRFKLTIPPMPSDIRVRGIYAVIPYLLGSTRIYRVIVINSNVDPGELPLRILIGLRWQGPEGRAVEGVKQFLAGARQLLEGAGIEGHQEGREGGIDLSQREEGVGPRTGPQPAVDDLHAPLHRGLIPG